MPKSSPIKRTLFILGVVVWAGAAAWGMKMLTDYSFRAGAKGAAPTGWPSDVSFKRARGASTLVIALHPECPCSRASVAELGSVLAQAGPSLQAILIFLDGDPRFPAQSAALYQQAAKIPGVTLLTDRDGVQLKKFGFLTSGESRLYRPDGVLAFSGGITGSRGHVGDNPGRAAVISWAQKASTRNASNFSNSANPPSATPVFGCALFDESGKP